MRRLILFAYLFRFSCLFIFSYQAWISFQDFLEKRTFTNSKFTKQEGSPLPLVCITTEGFDYYSFNNSLNVTNDEYVDGKWKVNNLSERELWDFLSPNLSDLITKIYFYKTLRNDSEKYSKVKIPVENLPGLGVEIKRKDYHSNPRIFCLSIRNINSRVFCFIDVLSF